MVVEVEEEEEEEGSKEKIDGWNWVPFVWFNTPTF